VLAHDNVDVQAAFITLHDGQNSSPLVDLCRRYAQYHDSKAGEDAANYLRSSELSNLTSSDALESLQLILGEEPQKLSSVQDVIVSELARSNVQVRQYLTQRLIHSTTEFFEDLFARGDESANCLRSVVLDIKLWQNEEVRLRVEDDLFVLFIAKLMESGHDHDGRALKGITLLLLADTQRLYTHIDEDAFDALLTSLDLRLPADVRGQATLVITKFMESSELEAQKYFVNFVTSRVSRQKADDLIISFSAAAQLFPVAGNLAAQLFLTQGFLPSLMPLLEQKHSSPTIHDTFLALINAACVDGACRKAIQESCSTWLSHKVSNGVGRQPTVAATVLAKLRIANASNRGGADQKASIKTGQDDVSDLVDLFQNSLVVESEAPASPSEGKNISDSIEGLAYTSLRPEVKEKLASNPKVIKALLKALEEHPISPEIVIGGLSIISNLTHYQPNLSEEQKKISQLKAYANASKPADVSELEDDVHVEKRNAALVKAGVVATLVKINKNQQPSSAATHLTDTILHSLSRSKSDRGTLAQQGAVRLLITHYQQQQQQSSQPSTTKPSLPPPRPQENNNTNQYSTTAAHGLARILISLNPTHVFPSSGTPNITSAIPPLVSLLTPHQSQSFINDNNSPIDLLPTFESLLALTNLASTSPTTSIATLITRTAWPALESLLLSSHVLLRRATTELICNLTANPQVCLSQYTSTSSPRARERLRILTAMADVDDLKTRLAAGGALAMLTDYEDVVQTLIEDHERLPRAIDIILDMMCDNDSGLKHRGFVVLLNLLNAPGETQGERVKTVVIGAAGIEKVKTALRDVRDQNVLQVGVDVLKILMGRS